MLPVADFFLDGTKNYWVAMVTLSLGWERGSLVLWTVGPRDFHRGQREGSDMGHIYIPGAHVCFLMGIPL